MTVSATATWRSPSSATIHYGGPAQRRKSRHVAEGEDLPGREVDQETGNPRLVRIRRDKAAQNQGQVEPGPAGHLAGERGMGCGGEQPEQRTASPVHLKPPPRCLRRTRLRRLRATPSKNQFFNLARDGHDRTAVGLMAALGVRRLRLRPRTLRGPSADVPVFPAVETKDGAVFARSQPQHASTEFLTLLESPLDQGWKCHRARRHGNSDGEISHLCRTGRPRGPCLFCEVRRFVAFRDRLGRSAGLCVVLRRMHCKSWLHSAA
jgi:hypothetical protein